jgi:prepilin signal peptidase PulO-like enzyme (type II secretory pathway)
MIVLLLVLLGLCFGSFINALVWRLYQQSLPKRKHPKGINLSILNGRSVCPGCGHQLAAKDLIPVLSWLTLRGRCRYCQRSISWQYPLVEASTALLFVGSYVWWPFGWSGVGIFQFVVWLIILVGFMALAIYDLRWMLLPDRVVKPLAILAVGQVIVLAVVKGDNALLWAAVWGLACLPGLFLVLYWASRGRWIGFGDVKLAVVLGLLVGGPLRAILLLFVASLVGSVVSLPLLATGRKALSRRVPFGPFLIIATIIVYLFGTGLITWYKRQFLLL